MAELAHDLADDVVVRDAHADGLFVALQEFRDAVVGLKDKGVGTREHPFHRLEHTVVKGFGVVRQVAQVMADKRQVILFLLLADDGDDALDALLFENVTPDSVDRVGRVNDDAAVLQTLHHGIHSLRVWVLGVNLQQHNLLMVKG